MAVSVFSSKGVMDTGEWYRVDAPEVSYRYTIANLASKDLVEVRGYAQNGLSTPIINIIFTDSSGSNIASYNTVDFDTGSSRNYSQLIVSVPVNAVGIKLGTLSSASFVFIRPFQVTPFPPLTPLKYDFTQGVVISNTAEVAVMGGGGAGGATLSSSGTKGGGGSGYLVHGTVEPGSYTVFVGAGAVGGTNNAQSASGGTTTFGNITAAGGLGGANAGGAGGSGGGGAGSQTSGAAGNPGGFNGNNGGGGNGGAGSGVTANLFTPSNAAYITGGQAAGGGVYGGGQGGGGSSIRGLNANATGGGGGGAGYRAGGGTVSQRGGDGFGGALWVLES